MMSDLTVSQFSGIFEVIAANAAPEPMFP